MVFPSLAVSPDVIAHTKSKNDLQLSAEALAIIENGQVDESGQLLKKTLPVEEFSTLFNDAAKATISDQQPNVDTEPDSTPEGFDNTAGTVFGVDQKLIKEIESLAQFTNLFDQNKTTILEYAKKHNTPSTPEDQLKQRVQTSWLLKKWELQMYDIAEKAYAETDGDFDAAYEATGKFIGKLSLSKPAGQYLFAQYSDWVGCRVVQDIREEEAELRKKK
ncbi:hypothetical protein HN954_03630 [bacterium]|jgi:hypothetical protein|nr:hypothetical protein [bacterium]MBT6996492.1 hypothetical protein [bacterium]MBT7772700.1 hypothetical protein [bacterium]